MSTRFPPFASLIALARSSLFASTTASAPRDMASADFSFDDVTAITFAPQSFAN